MATAPESLDPKREQDNGNPPASQPAQDEPPTLEQLAAQVANIDSRIGGIHSNSDKANAGVNKILGILDTARSAEQQRVADQVFETALGDVPEEQRDALRLLYRQRVPIEQPGPAASPEADRVREQAEDTVRRYGFQPDDPRINYSHLTEAADPGIPEFTAFNQHLQSLGRPDSPAPASAPAPSNGITKTPPTNVGPTSDGPGAGEDELLDMLLRKDITREEYGRRMEVRGNPVKIGYER
jgi:hypothetical protein